MIKAQLCHDADGDILRVCGRLAGDSVSELERCWQTAGARPGLAVDLRGVTFIDASGENLLAVMHRDGATFLASGVLIREVIYRITGASK